MSPVFTFEYPFTMSLPQSVHFKVPEGILGLAAANIGADIIKMAKYTEKAATFPLLLFKVTLYYDKAKKGLHNPINWAMIRTNFISFLNEACRKLHNAAEGVTLSGVRKDEDCKLTELWRNPLDWVPKVQSVHTLISQAKGQSDFPF